MNATTTTAAIRAAAEIMDRYAKCFDEFGYDTPETRSAIAAIITKRMSAPAQAIEADVLARGVMPNYDPLGEKTAADVVLVDREEAAKVAESKAATRCMQNQKSAKGVCGYVIASEIRALPPYTKEHVH